jgi:hypothetical protein
VGKDPPEGEEEEEEEEEEEIEEDVAVEEADAPEVTTLLTCRG